MRRSSARSFFAALAIEGLAGRAGRLPGRGLRPATADLRAGVEALLAAHAQARQLPRTARARGTVATVDEPPRRRAAPARSSARTSCSQQIGEGGMGAVFMAEQTEPVRRQVALKLIKPGMDSAQVLARFEAERQALALMDHPNIAKVLDAGTTDARPALLRHGAGQGRPDHRATATSTG